MDSKKQPRFFLHKHLIKLKEEKTKPTKTMQKLYSRLINILKLSA